MTTGTQTPKPAVRRRPHVMRLIEGAAERIAISSPVGQADRWRARRREERCYCAGMFCNDGICRRG